MSKFIEIPVNGEKCIINLDAIQSVCPLKGGGCEIYFLEGALKSVNNCIYNRLLLNILYVINQKYGLNL